jgi:hypothetical protein
MRAHSALALKAVLSFQIDLYIRPPNPATTLRSDSEKEGSVLFFFSDHSGVPCQVLLEGSDGTRNYW